MEEDSARIVQGKTDKFDEDEIQVKKDEDKIITEEDLLNGGETPLL